MVQTTTTALWEPEHLKYNNGNNLRIFFNNRRVADSARRAATTLYVEANPFLPRVASERRLILTSIIIDARDTPKGTNRVGVGVVLPHSVHEHIHVNNIYNMRNSFYFHSPFDAVSSALVSPKRFLPCRFLYLSIQLSKPILLVPSVAFFSLFNAIHLHNLDPKKSLIRNTCKGQKPFQAQPQHLRKKSSKPLVPYYVYQVFIFFYFSLG